MQPHLALSAIFSLGLRGIERKIVPSLAPISQLGEDRSSVKMLATNLDEATRTMMREGSVAREVFGDAFVEHFGGTRLHEVGQWNAAVTSWERKWIFHTTDGWTRVNHWFSSGTLPRACLIAVTG